MPSFHSFRTLRFFLLFLPDLSLRVESTRLREYLQTVNEYDSAVGTVENFDPAQANPVRNITCIGDDLALQLPMIGDFNPNLVSVHKICAKPQYNGGGRRQHAGGYCHEPPFAPYTGDVSFDTSYSADASPELQNARVLLACRYRCYCNWGVADVSIQPKANFRRAQFDVHPRASGSTYEISIDIDNDFTIPWTYKMGRQGSIPVDTLVLNTRPQLATEARQTNHRQQYGVGKRVSLDPGNKILCDNTFPTFNLPPPHERWEIIGQSGNHAQQLCATQLSGGSKYANAGGYCHRESAPNGPTSEVWFDDDMTPRSDWTWNGGNFFASASIRFFCWQHCSCTTALDTNRNTSAANKRLWTLPFGQQMIQAPNGAMYLHHMDTKSPHKDVQVLPPQYGPGSRSGTCGVNSTNFCPQVWDEHMYGPVRRAPANAINIVKPPANNANRTVCGNICHSTSDCGSTDSNYSCSCAFPSSDDARKLGLDPVYPVAACLVLFLASTQSSLGGRNLPSYVDARGVPHACRCTDEKIGVECCGRGNGVISTSNISALTVKFE